MTTLYIFFINDHIYPQTDIIYGDSAEDCDKKFAAKWAAYNPKILDRIMEDDG